MSIAGPLVDRFGRVHTDLRISVTDRCNLRCVYCMREEGVVFRSHGEILRFEEIQRFVQVAARLGIREVRLTGGEPLVRRGVCRLVEMLASVPGIDDLAMTTNGILLPKYAEALKAAGLSRLNISLDTLDPRKFRQIARRDELPRVLDGIAAAERAGFRKTKLNALAIRGYTEDEVVPLAQFARRHGMELRFIEFMPLDGDDLWEADRVLPGEEILKILTDALGPLERVTRDGSRAPAAEYRFLDGGPPIGLVNSVSHPWRSGTRGPCCEPAAPTNNWPSCSSRPYVPSKRSMVAGADGFREPAGPCTRLGADAKDLLPRRSKAACLRATVFCESDGG